MSEPSGRPSLKGPQQCLGFDGYNSPSLNLCPLRVREQHRVPEIGISGAVCGFSVTAHTPHPTISVSQAQGRGMPLAYSSRHYREPSGCGVLGMTGATLGLGKAVTCQSHITHEGSSQPLNPSVRRIRRLHSRALHLPDSRCSNVPLLWRLAGCEGGLASPCLST